MSLTKGNKKMYQEKRKQNKKRTKNTNTRYKRRQTQQFNVQSTGKQEHENIFGFGVFAPHSVIVHNYADVYIMIFISRDHPL